jgi:hypothetical protein
MEDENAMFHLPVDNIVAETAKVTPAATPEPSILTTSTPADQLSDQALFDELNSVSEELISCRNRVLSNIS